MQAAIVGYGDMGQLYEQLIQQQNWKLIGIHDTDKTKCPPDKFFPDRGTLISDPQVNVVIISTPHREHLQIVKECLKLQKHVILEKPMGSSQAESEKIYRKIQKYRATSVVVVNMTHCFYDNIQKAKKLLATQDVKTITTISDAVVFPIMEGERDAWLFKTKHVGHGVMLTNGCHLLARILYLFSEHRPRFEVVGGICSNFNRLGDINDTQAHMRLNLILGDQQKIPVNIYANWPMAKSADEPILESMRVHINGGIQHIQAWKEVAFYPDPKAKPSQEVPYTRNTIKPEQVKGVTNVLKAFEEAVTNKEATLHDSVELAYQAEQAISTFYATCK